MSLVSSNYMGSQQHSEKDLVAYWKPHLVREAGEIAIKTPRDQMENIMVQATEFMEQLPWKGVKKNKCQSLAWPRTSVILKDGSCLLYTSPSPRDRQKSRMPSSA